MFHRTAQLISEKYEFIEDRKDYRHKWTTCSADYVWFLSCWDFPIIHFQNQELCTTQCLWNFYGFDLKNSMRCWKFSLCSLFKLFGAPAPSSLHSCPPGRVASRCFWWMHGQTLHPGGGTWGNWLVNLPPPDVPQKSGLINHWIPLIRPH